MYRFRIVRVGRGRTAWANTAVADYTKRLKRHGRVDEVLIKPVAFKGDVDAVRAAEAERLLKHVGARDVLVALDERGEGPTSEAFAAMVSDLNLEGTVVFVIGGAYGLDPGVRSAARRVVKLSDAVLNHEVARVVLFEQVYRAVTLLEGIPYHH